MPASTTLWRHQLKETDPEKYAEFLQKERERARLQRQKKKEKYMTEHLTRAVLQEKKRETELARERWRRYYARKHQSTRRSTTRSKSAAEPENQPKKCPKNMTPMEYKAHKRELRAKSRAREGPQKKRRIREKDALRKRLKRQQQKKMSTPEPPPQNPLESLKKADYNFVSTFRQKLIKRSETPMHFAKMVKNVASKALTPRKKQALSNAGLRVEQQNVRRNLIGSATRTFFGNGAAKSVTNNVRKRLFQKQRQQRKDALSMQDRQKVRLFYLREDISRILPHKRYARKEGSGYVMQQTLKNAYNIFKLENPGLKLGYSKFTMLRPRTVRKICSTFSDTCQCVSCLNIRLKIQTINRIVAALSLDPSIRINNEIDLVNLILCDKGEARFSKAECIHGTCPNCCDVESMLRKHYAPLIALNPEVTWTSWRRKKEEGKTSRLPVIQQSPFSVLFEELLEDIIRPAQNTTFPKHLFVAHWQYHQYRLLKKSLKTNQVMMVMDFAENRKARFQDEIKSAHYDKRQITLHPVIIFYRERQTGHLVRHALNFISDDIIHDHNAVHHFTEQSIRFLSTSRILLPDSEIIIFSDGCAAQYKGRGTFADLTHYSVPIQRVFFGSEHGKGEADGETGTISKSLETAVLCRQTIVRNAADLFRWSVENLTKNEECSKRNFFLVSCDDIIRNRPESDVKLIQGSRKFHQVVKVAPFVLKARPLACFCPACQRNDYKNCSNNQYVEPFQVYHLQQCRSDGFSPSHTENHELTRAEFFTKCQQKLIQAKSSGFQAFVKCARESKQCADTRFVLDLMPVEEPCFTRDLTDHISASLVPRDFVHADRFPLQTAAEGNCLPLSLSTAVLGDGQYHQELRVRIAWELALNKMIYLSPQNVSHGTDLDGCTSLNFYHQTGDFPHLNLFSAYDEEVMACAGNSIYMGPWQLHAAANILQRQICSVYSDLSDGPFRPELNRTFHPHTATPVPLFPIYILWSSCSVDRENADPAVWTANHFVPLVREGGGRVESVQRCMPRIGDFVKVTYTINRKPHSFMAVVSPTPEHMQARLGEGDFVVTFLTKSAHGDYYVFPAKEQVYAVSFTEAKIDLVDPPFVNQRGHHKFYSS